MIEEDDIAAGSSRSLFGVPLEVCLCGVWWFIVCGTDYPLGVLELYLRDRRDVTCA